MNCQMNYGHVLHENMLKQVREVYDARQQRLASLRTKEDALAYVNDVRAKIFKSFGPLPPKTPLNAKVVERREYDGFAVEKVIYFSRPGFPVSANLYLPLNANVGECPGVIGACGHDQSGKAARPYQKFCQSLALHGFAALMYDPISQGERYQYLDHSEFLGCCGEHNMMGKSLNLMGGFFGSWRVFDGIRALDYLLTRPEVDGSRVGVTGNSGGGTLSTYLNTFDDRFTMAAPSCFITSYLHNFENELPADSEQIPPNILHYGIEMADFIIARAPRPAIILGQMNDYFDARGTVEAYQDALKVYELLGAGDNVKVFVGPNGHGYHDANRDAMYKFFCRHAGVEYAGKELSTIDLIPEKELLCCEKGQLHYMPNEFSRVRDFIDRQAVELKAQRPALSLPQMKEKALKLMGIDGQIPVPYFRVMRTGNIATDAGECLCNRLLLENTDGSIKCMLKFYGDDGGGKALFHLPQKRKAHLHIPHMFADTELAAGRIKINDFADEEFCFVLETNGSGEMFNLSCLGENHVKQYFAVYGTEYFYDSYHMMLGKSYLGSKVENVLSAVALLKERGYKNIRLSGNGLGATVAAFAALICDDVEQVALDNYLPSFQNIIDTPVNYYLQSNTLRGVLEYFDLDDVYRNLKSKNISLGAECTADKIDKL